VEQVSGVPIAVREKRAKLVEHLLSLMPSDLPTNTGDTETDSPDSLAKTTTRTARTGSTSRVNSGSGESADG